MKIITKEHSKKEIWTLAEQKHGVISDVSYELLAWGRSLLPGNQEDYVLCSIVLSDEIDDIELKKLTMSGAEKIYCVTDRMLGTFTVDPFSKVLVDLINNYKPDVIIASATSTGRTIMPYVSVLVHTGLTADCTELKIDKESGLLLQTRPAIGGNILATIKTPVHRPQMATVRPKSISKPKLEYDRKSTVVNLAANLDGFQNRTEIEGFIAFEQEGPSIESAKIVVAGGKGLKSKQNFYLIEDLSKLLGGAIGSSRPPVDQGWRPYPNQVGLSGKTISPDLYIACGISGSVQHLAGIQTAANIIAINNDPHAQIFQVSDIGVVADVFELLPVLIEKLQKGSVD